MQYSFKTSPKGRGFHSLLLHQQLGELALILECLPVRRACGIDLHADAKHPGLHAGLSLIKIIGLRQNFVKRFLITLSRAHAVCWNVLKAVAGSDVHGAALSQLPGRVGGSPDTGFAALYPEPAGLRIRRRQRQRGSFCVIYLAYSTALVSRIRLTLIWPGYSSSFSIFLAISRARMIMLSSVTSSGLTIMRTSRPA